MIRYEFRKLFQNRCLVLILLLLFAVNGSLLWNLPIPGGAAYSGIDGGHIRSLYAALPEEPEQVLAALEAGYDGLWESEGPFLTRDVYSERQLFSTVIERVQEVAGYDDTLQGIDFDAETLLLTGRYPEGSYEYRNVIRSREVYKGLENVEPKLFYSGAVELLAGERLTDVVLLLLCLLVGMELTVSERQTMALLKPTRRGGLPLIRAKIGTVLILSALGTVVLYGTNLAIGLLRCGSFPLDVPIQSVHGFLRSPWHITVGQYLLGFFLWKVLWAGAVSACVFVVCHLGRSVMECCAGFLLSLVLLPTGNVERFFIQYRSRNIFGYPVFEGGCNLIAILLCMTAGFSLAIWLHLHGTVPARRQIRLRRQAKINTRMIFHESGKVLFHQGGIWILTALVLIQIIGAVRFDPWIPPQERLYMQYSEILSGPATEEKEHWLRSEEARYAELYEKLESYSQALGSGEMDEESYQILTGSIVRQLDNEEIFLRAREQYVRMKEKGCDYVCQTGYDRLLGSEGEREGLILMIQVLLSLSIALSPIHAVEQETNVELLRNATPWKTRSNRCKRIIQSLYALVACLIAFVPQVWKIVVHYGLTGLESPAGSVDALEIQCGTVLSSLCIYGTGLLLISLFAAWIVGWISRRTGSTVRTTIISGLMILPLLLMLS